MPFTPAHVAAVLPVMGRRRPRWCVPSALAIGAMVPDAQYFLPVRGDRSFSHSLTGIVTLDLVLGLVAFGWWRWAAPALRDLSPGAVRDRLPVPVRPGGRQWLAAAVCVVVGALTHVAWDAFTHADGWVVRHVPSLREPVLGSLAAFKLAQFASGILGTAVVAWWVWNRLRTTAPMARGAALSSARERSTSWLVVATVPVVVAVATVAQQLRFGTSAEVLAFAVVTRVIGVAAAVLVCLVVWWHVAVASRRDAGSLTRV